jgi:hypothetical protein
MDERRQMTVKPADGPLLLENLLAPEVFMTEVSSISLSTGMITLTLASHRFDNSIVPPVQRKVVVARIVMPVAGAKNLAVGLYDFLAKNGMDPVKRPTEASNIQ